MPETRMGKIDSLSKRPDWKVEVKNNNENQKLIKEEWVRRMMKVVVEELEMILIEKSKRAREMKR